MPRLTMKPLIISLALMAQATATAEVMESDFSFKTTGHLYELCAAEEGGKMYIPAIYACRGFMEGVAQYHDAVSVGKDVKRLVCAPPTATLQDARKIFVAWGEANRGDDTLMNEAPVVGLVRSLVAKYPCPNQ